MAQCPDLKDMLTRQQESSRYIAAICAAPAKVLLPFGILKNQNATCYPAYHDKLKNQKHIHDKVVVDHNLSNISSFYIYYLIKPLV